MNHLADWIKRHQIIAFFVITFAITWGLGFSYSAFYKGQFLMAPLAFLATCGPALAGIIISASLQYPAQARYTQGILDRLLYSVDRVCARFYCRHHDPQPCCIIPSVDRLHLRYGGAGCLCDRHNPFAHPDREKLPGLVDPVARCVGMGASGTGHVSGYNAAFDPYKQRLDRQPIAVHQFQETGLALIGLVTVKFFYQFFFFNATGEGSSL